MDYTARPMPEAPSPAGSTSGKRVSEIMSRGVLTVGPEQPIDDVVAVIVDHVITSVPVVDDDLRCIGIVSESDVLGRRGRVVADIMTRDVLTVEEASSLEEAAELFLTRRIRRLPVIRDGTLVGVLTRADLVRHVRETRWICEWCGTAEIGVRPPNACRACGGMTWGLIAEGR